MKLINNRVATSVCKLINNVHHHVQKKLGGMFST